MNIDRHESFQHMIDESLSGILSAEKEQSLCAHLASCVPCQKYLNASKRVIAGLSGFSFEVDPVLSMRVTAALKLRVEGGRRNFARDTGMMQRHRVPLKKWAAFAVALSMSMLGSGLVYQTAERLAIPRHLGAAQIEAGVLLFWLLPSLWAACFLFAAPVEKRGMA